MAGIFIVNFFRKMPCKCIPAKSTQGLGCLDSSQSKQQNIWMPPDCSQGFVPLPNAEMCTHSMRQQTPLAFCARTWGGFSREIFTLPSLFPSISPLRSWSKKIIWKQFWIQWCWRQMKQFCQLQHVFVKTSVLVQPLERPVWVCSIRMLLPCACAWPDIGRFLRYPDVFPEAVQNTGSRCWKDFWCLLRRIWVDTGVFSFLRVSGPQGIWGELCALLGHHTQERDQSRDNLSYLPSQLGCSLRSCSANGS